MRTLGPTHDNPAGVSCTSMCPAVVLGIRVRKNREICPNPEHSVRLSMYTLCTLQVQQYPRSTDPAPPTQRVQRGACLPLRLPSVFPADSVKPPSCGDAGPPPTMHGLQATHVTNRQRPAFALGTAHMGRRRISPGQPQGREDTSHHASKKPQPTQCHTPEQTDMQQLCDVHCRRKQSSPGCLCVTTARMLLVRHSQRQRRRHDAGQTTTVTGREGDGVSTRSHAFLSMYAHSSTNLQWPNEHTLQWCRSGQQDGSEGSPALACPVHTRTRGNKAHLQPDSRREPLPAHGGYPRTDKTASY